MNFSQYDDYMVFAFDYANDDSFTCLISVTDFYTEELWLSLTEQDRFDYIIEQFDYYLFNNGRDENDVQVLRAYAFDH